MLGVDNRDDYMEGGHEREVGGRLYFEVLIRYFEVGLNEYCDK